MIKKLHHTATGQYAAALATDPELADDLEALQRHDAACHGAPAAAGQGVDAAKLDDKERTRLRRQSLDWLKADLALRGKQLETGERQARRPRPSAAENAPLVGGSSRPRATRPSQRTAVLFIARSPIRRAFPAGLVPGNGCLATHVIRTGDAGGFNGAALSLTKFTLGVIPSPKENRRVG